MAVQQWIKSTILQEDLNLIVLIEDRVFPFGLDDRGCTAHRNRLQHALLVVDLASSGIHFDSVERRSRQIVHENPICSFTGFQSKGLHSGHLHK